MDGTVDEIELIESVDVRDYEKNVAFFAQKRYDAIITTGIGLTEATIRSAALFPGSVFIGINQTPDAAPSNFIPVTFPEDRMGYFAGVLAARLTRTGIVGGVCETSGIDSMWRYCEGFRAGAESVNSRLTVVVAYRNSGSRDTLFADRIWGFDTASGLIRDGADVIFAAGGGTGQGALAAASQKGVISIGAERDQAAALKEDGSSVVASVYGDAGVEIRILMRLLDSEPLQPRQGNGLIQYVRNDRVIPLDLIPELDALLAELSQGITVTNVPTSAP
jgi:basic membrane protein A